MAVIFKGPVKIGKYVVVEKNPQLKELTIEGDTHNHYHTDNSSHPTQVNIQPVEEVDNNTALPMELRLPEELSTAEALKYWSRLQREGIVDSHFQPLCSRAEMSLVAYEMAKRLAIENMWSVFGEFWQKKYLSAEYSKAKSLQKKDSYLEMLRKKIFN